MGQETSWTLIHAAAEGEKTAGVEFVNRYGSVVRAYLGARWRGRPLVSEIEDTLQEVWLQCFREGGALERIDPNRDGGFRAFLYGIARREAQKVEGKRARERVRRADGTFRPDEMDNDETSLSKIFDRAWALRVMDEAWNLYEMRARERGEDALHRLEVLRLRTRENSPPRKIAEALGSDAAQVSRDYAQARKEFWTALREVVGLHERCTGKNLDENCEQLVGYLRRGVRKSAEGLRGGPGARS